MKRFIEDDDGSMGERERSRAGALRDAHDALNAKLNKLDSGTIEPYHAAPALLVAGGDLFFVRDIFGVPVRQEADLDISVADLL